MDADATSEKTREELKAALVADPETGMPDYFKLQARCVRAFGPEAGVFLRQLVFRTGQSHLESGWLWKTEQEMFEETGLTRTQQRKARKILVTVGAVEEERRGVPRRMHYRVDFPKVRKLLDSGRSVLNQWKVGMKFDKETRKLYRPESENETLNPRYSEVPITNPASEVPNTDPASEVDSTDPTIQRERHERTSEKTPKSSDCSRRLTRNLAAESAVIKDENSSNADEVTLGNNGIPAADPARPREAEEEGVGDAPVRIADPPRLSGRLVSDLLRLMWPPEGDRANPVSDLATRYLEGRPDAGGEPITPERIAAEVRITLGGSEPIESYVVQVERVLEAMSREEVAV